MLLVRNVHVEIVCAKVSAKHFSNEIIEDYTFYFIVTILRFCNKLTIVSFHLCFFFTLNLLLPVLVDGIYIPVLCKYYRFL